MSSADHGVARPPRRPAGLFFPEAVSARDTSEPREFPSLDSYKKRFLCAHKEVDLAPHPVVRLVLQVEIAEKFSLDLSLESLDSFLRVSKQGPCFTLTRDLYNLNLLAKLMALLRQIHRGYHC